MAKIDKEDEIRKLREELEVVREAYAIVIRRAIQRENKRMYGRILKDKEGKGEEEAGTRHIAEVYSLRGYIKDDNKEETEEDESESEDSEDVQMGRITCDMENMENGRP